MHVHSSSFISNKEINNISDMGGSRFLISHDCSYTFMLVLSLESSAAVLLVGVNTNQVIMVQQGLFHESFLKPTFPHVGQLYDTLLVLVIK